VAFLLIGRAGFPLPKEPADARTVSAVFGGVPTVPSPFDAPDVGETRSAVIRARLDFPEATLDELGNCLGVGVSPQRVHTILRQHNLPTRNKRPLRWPRREKK